MIRSAFLPALLMSLACSAQDIQPLQCGHDQATQQLYAKYPGLETEATANKARMLEEGKRNLEDSRNATPPTYIIPVVFHIIHDYGSENISDAQVMDAVSILNEDFRKLNADTSQIVAPFDTLAADAEIEFRLAQLDPNGNCTNGIERIASMETYVGDNGSKLNQWPRDKYLNIWVVQTIYLPGQAGYAYFPSTVNTPQTESLDGIIMLHSYIGSIGTGSPTTKRFLTHEVGHWLGLAHPGAANVCMDGDGITDTPISSGWSFCQLTNNDVCNPGTPENVQNFMEFSYCLRMFTRGQRDFMHAVLNSSVASRNNLWTNANLMATGALNTTVACLPHADFKSNKKMICEGGTIQFTDQTWNVPITTWQWTIAGPVTLTSPLQSPSFVFNTAGEYDVTLIAGNAAGNDTITKTNFIIVSDDSSMFNSFYSEGFETPGTFATFGYVANDRYGNGNTFQQTSTVGHTGTSSVIRPFGNSVQGDIDELITPAYDLSYNTGLQLSFVYAFATADTTTFMNTQVLKVWSSVNCGQSWIARWSRTASAVVTGPTTIGPFTPTLSDWDTITINLPGSCAVPNIRFKFEFTSPHDAVASDLYIDDINILSTNVGVNENANNSSFTIYPNPGNGKSTFAYTLTEAADVRYLVYDVSGRLISSVDQGQQTAGSYSVQMKENLSPGTYLIEMKAGEQVSVQKYIVAE